MRNHAWCRDVPRDLAVRAAEDGRSGPLPTLEQAIWAARLMMPKSVSPTSAPEQENNGDRMRTERITLEVTHDLDAPLRDWIVQVIDESLGFDEYVRVVEESAPPARGWLTEEEREAVDAARDYFDNDDHGDSECVFIARVLKQLLARSSPPEVVLPGKPLAFRYGDDAIANRDGQWRAALAAAGVAVTEGNR